MNRRRPRDVFPGVPRKYSLTAGFTGSRRTIAGRFRSPESPDDYSGGTTYTGFHLDGFHRAVAGAGPAFHTGITVDYLRPAIFYRKNTMRANNPAETAAHAFIRI